MVEKLLTEVLETLKDQASTNPSQIKFLKLLKLNTVAELLDVSVPNLRNMIKDGVLSTVQYKGTVRIRATQVEDFIKKHTI